MITLKFLLGFVVAYHIFNALRKLVRGWSFLGLLEYITKLLEKTQKMYDTKLKEGKTLLFEIAWRTAWFIQLAIVCTIAYLCCLGINTL